MTRISTGWAKPNLEARISAYIRAWEDAKKAGHPHPPETYPFVTLSREFGCEALPLALKLVELLNKSGHPSLPWVAYDKELLDKVAHELHLRREVVDSLDGRRRGEMTELFDGILNKKVDEVLIFRKLAEVIRSAAFHGHSVIVGRGSYRITRDLKTGFHVRLTASREWRIQKVAASHQLGLADARKFVERGEKERANFLNTFFVEDPSQHFSFDLVIENSRFDLDQMAGIVIAALTTRFDQRLLSS